MAPPSMGSPPPARRAIVIEAMGSGNAVPLSSTLWRGAARRGVAVAVTSRVPGGRARATYGPGHDLVAAGAVMVPRLRAGQARVLLMGRTGRRLPVDPSSPAGADGQARLSLGSELVRSGCDREGAHHSRPGGAGLEPHTDPHRARRPAPTRGRTPDVSRRHRYANR